MQSKTLQLCHDRSDSSFTMTVKAKRVVVCGVVASLRENQNLNVRKEGTMNISPPN